MSTSTELRSVTMHWEAANHWSTAKLIIGVRLFFGQPFAGIVRHDVFRAVWRLYTPKGPVDMECVLTLEGIAKIELEFAGRCQRNDNHLRNHAEAACLGKRVED